MRVGKRYPRSSDYDGQDGASAHGLYAARTYVVSFLLEPVERGLSTVCAVAGCRVRNAVGRICTASARNLCLGYGDVRSGPGDIALESGHVV